MSEEKSRKPFKKRPDKSSVKEKVIIGLHDVERREKLIRNAEFGLGKVEQRGKHLYYTVGNDMFGYVEYVIVDAKLPDIEIK